MKKVIFVILLLISGYAFGETDKTNNDVILPQTEFFVEGASSPVMEKREVIVPSYEDKKQIYETPTIKSVDILEKEAKKELSEEIKSKIISLFSYGINDILNFSLIGLSQIPVDSVSISTVIKYDRFKRPDVVSRYDEYTVLKNTFKDVDLVNLSVGVSSAYVFWNTVFEFSEELKGLWNNSIYLDEKDRVAYLDSKLRYRIDKDSTLNTDLFLSHWHNAIRDKLFSYYYTSLNDFSIRIGYKYGIEDFNFFSMNLGIGSEVVKFTDKPDLESMVYGDISFSFMFPFYGNSWFLGLNVGIVPNTFFPMEWYSKLHLGYKLNDYLVTFLLVFKDYDRFDYRFLNRSLNFLYSLPSGDSYIGVELNPRLFFLGNSSINVYVGYSYYLSKVYDKYQNDIYILDTTNAVVVYSKVGIDVISISWLNLSGSYRFSLFIPSLPYISTHSVEATAKITFGSFSFSLGITGETARITKFDENSTIPPYLGVSSELEWEIVKNLAILLKVDNALNNLIEVRKDSIIYEPFYVLGGLKVKL